MKRLLCILVLCGCASNPLPKVQHVSQSAADVAVQICLAAHQINEIVNIDLAKQAAVEAKVDDICAPILDGLDALTAAAASEAVAKMRADLAKLFTP